MSTTADGQVIINLQLQQDEFDRRLSELEGKTANFGKKIKNILLSIGVGAMAKKVSGYIYNVGSSFEETMSKVQAISGATSEELALLTDKAKEMGSKTKFSATEAGEAFTYMAMAGWRTEDMLDGIEGIMNLAAASGEDLAQVSDIVTDSLTAFGLSAKDSAHFADVLAKASSSSNTNVSMMGETFKYVAPIAGALGYSIEDTAVAIGLMANAGIKGSQAGTALRSLMSRLTKPTDDVAAAMDILNISLTDSQGNMKSFDQIILDLRKSFSGLSESQKAEMAATLGGQEAMSGLLAIVNASDEDFQKLTNEINNADGSAKKMADTMNNNLNGSLTIMKSALEGIGISLYEKVSGPLKKIVDVITKDVLGAINDLVNEKITFDEFASKIGNMLTKALSSLVSQIPKFVSAGVSMIASFSNGFAQGIPNFISNILTIIQQFGDSVAQSTPVIIQKGFETLSNFVSGIINALPVMIQKIPKIISTFANVINDNFPTVLAKGGELLLQFISGLLGAIPVLIENIPQIISAIWDTFMAFQWLNLGKNIISFLGNGISSMFGFIGEKGLGVVQTIVNKILSLPSKLFAIGKNAISQMGGGISGLGSWLKSQAGNIVNWVVGAVQSLPNKMLNIGSNLVKGLWNGIKSVKDWILKKIKSFTNGIIDGIKSFFGIHSPSKLMADEVGKYLPKGLVVGFETEMPKSSKNMNNSLENFTNSMKDKVHLSMSDLSNGMRFAGNINNTSTQSQFPKSVKMDGNQDIYLVTEDGQELAHWIAPYLNNELVFI